MPSRAGRRGPPAAQGPWSAGGERADAEHAGLLIIEGVIARDVVVSDTVSTELLGPATWCGRGACRIRRAPASTIRWTALTDVSVAVLDRRFAGLLARWPEVNAVLGARLNERTHRLATTQAISHSTAWTGGSCRSSGTSPSAGDA